MNIKLSIYVIYKGKKKIVIFFVWWIIIKIIFGGMISVNKMSCMFL